MFKPAPIVLFVYKRPDLTRAVLQALSGNELSSESKLYVFCDGPKPGESPEGIRQIEETRAIVRLEKWCGEVEIVDRDKNMGLAESIISGVTSVISMHGRVIVLEDDIVPTPFFLRYMNDALNLHVGEQRVISIGALNFFAYSADIPETFFISIPDCWGWATWSDRWSLFERDSKLLLAQLHQKGLIGRFNLNGSYNYEQMLIDQINGRNNSWAIRWQAVAFINQMLSLYPRHSVVRNLGHDSSATHGRGNDVFARGIPASQPIRVVKIPVQENDQVNMQMEATYQAVSNPSPKSIFQRWKSRIGL